MPRSLTHDERRARDERDPDRFFRTDHLTADLGGRSARGGAVTLASQGLKFVVSTAATIILARLLTPADYGLVGMVAIVFNFVQMFQYMGLSMATVKWAELTHRQVSNLFWVNVTLSAGIAAAMAASAPLVARFYGEPRLTLLVAGYAVTVLLTGLAIQHEALLSRQMRFGALAFVDLASLAVGLVASVVAARYGLGYWALLLGQVVTVVARIVGVWTATGWRPGLPRRDTGVRALLSYGGNVTGFNLINFFSRNLDNALIGKFWGSHQLGLYAKAYQMLMLPMEQLNAPIASVALPALSRLSDSPERYRAAYLRVLEKITMITMPGIALMIATSDWLALFLLGPQWAEAGRIFMLLGLAALVQPATRTVLWLFTTQGRTRELLKWGGVSGAIAVVSIVAGLPWGAAGVAAAYAATDLCVTTPLLVWYVGRSGPVRAADFYRTVAPSACAAVCTLAALFVARPWLEPFALFARLAVAGLLAVGVSLLVFLMLPAGRRAIQSFKETLLLVWGRKNESAV